MSVLISPYNTTLARLVGATVALSSLKLMLLDATAAFDASQTTLNAVAGVGHTKEVYGFGWTQGGQALTGVAAVTTGSRNAMLTVTNLAVLAVGGSIGPARYAVIYDDADVNDAPLLFIDLSTARTAGAGTTFVVTFDTAGLLSFAYAT